MSILALFVFFSEQLSAGIFCVTGTATDSADTANYYHTTTNITQVINVPANVTFNTTSSK